MAFGKLVLKLIWEKRVFHIFTAGVVVCIAWLCRLWFSLSGHSSSKGTAVQFGVIESPILITQSVM